MAFGKTVSGHWLYRTTSLDKYALRFKDAHVTIGAVVRVQDSKKNLHRMFKVQFSFYVFKFSSSIISSRWQFLFEVPVAVMSCNDSRREWDLIAGSSRVSYYKYLILILYLYLKVIMFYPIYIIFVILNIWPYIPLYYSTLYFTLFVIVVGCYNSITIFI